VQAEGLGQEPEAVITLAFWLDAMEAMLKHFAFVLRYGDPASLQRVASLLAGATREMRLAVRRRATEVRARLHRQNPARKSEPKLETLENEFIRLRAAAVEARRLSTLAVRRSKRGSKPERIAARKAATVADQLGQMARDSARTLRDVLVDRGAWNRKWAEEIGLLEWL